MIHDIAPHVFDNAYTGRPPRPDDIALHYDGDQVLLIDRDGSQRLPSMAEIEQHCPGAIETAKYLFSIDGQGFYLANHAVAGRIPGAQFHSTQLFREMQPLHMGFAGITGSQLYRFYASHRFCGRCGKPTVHSDSERAVHCPACGLTEYPRVSPAIIVAITDGDKLLMARSARSTYRRFALVAGFVEIGETFEEAVRREVAEEVGLRVKNIRYYKSQPWAFSDSEMIGFFAELDGDPAITLDQKELAEARWFRRDEIPEPASTISISAELIIRFRDGLVD